MRGAVWLGIVGLFAGTSCATTKAATPSWGTLRDEARAARAAKDDVAYRDRVADLYALSGSVGLAYELAVAEARLHHRARAIALLTSFADAGLVEDVGAEEAFASLRTDPAFARIARTIAANRAPVGQAAVAFELPHDDLLTEDVAYDAGSRTFFVSSIHRRKVIAVDARGAVSERVAPSAFGGIAGIAVAHGRLWATAVDIPHVEGHRDDAPHRTAVLAFDLASGALLEHVELDAAGAHSLTDVAVAPNGDVYASDALGGNVYVLGHGAHRLEPLAAPGLFVSPQTPAPLDDRHILVPDYVRGIAAIDRATDAVTWLPHPPDVATEGLDGIYLDGDGAHLLGVQNGTTPVRIVRYTLDQGRTRITACEVLLQGLPGLGEPTHGVRVEDAFYILANAGWNRWTDGGAVREGAPPDAPAILELR